jgi:uncharacterized membrane protein
LTYPEVFYIFGVIIAQIVTAAWFAYGEVTAMHKLGQPWIRITAANLLRDLLEIWMHYLLVKKMQAGNMSRYRLVIIFSFGISRF